MTDGSSGASQAGSLPGRALGLVRTAGLRAADALLPPRCLACGAIAPGDGAVCGACWGGLSFIERPWCACCGLPFEFAIEDGALCGGCAAGLPAFDAARAVLRYDDASRPLILSFKHGDRMQAGRHFGGWMARAGAELAQRADLVAPVPLHWRRLAARRYNQSAELARGVAAAAGIGLCVDLLRRTRATPSQGGLTRRARRLNVRGAFAVAPRRRPAIQDARILLVDDVLTTGATVEAAARTLKRAGAAGVDVLVLARVVRGAAPE